MRKLVIAIVVLALILVVVDRGGDYAAERVAADNLKSSQNLQSGPDVDIHGLPFLTQFASGNYDHVSVDADNVPIGRNASVFELSHLHVDLNQLSVNRGFSDFHVNSATVTGLLDYADLSTRLGIKVRYAGDGRIEASKRFSALGRTFRPEISVRPNIANGVLGFGKASINNVGQLGDTVTQALTKFFDVKVPFQGIPFDVTVRSLRADAKGLELSLVGSDLSYSAR